MRCEAATDERNASTEKGGRDPEMTEPRVPSAADLQAVIQAERTGPAFVYWRTGDGFTWRPL